MLLTIIAGILKALVASNYTSFCTNCYSSSVLLCQCNDIIECGLFRTRVSPVMSAMCRRNIQDDFEMRIFIEGVPLYWLFIGCVQEILKSQYLCCMYR